tara:strand:+ start:7742 stop:8266 length:525 start_codon:yes stop_codon:yes gene_type:complete
MVTLPSVGGLARQYLASFSGDDFTPKTLEQAGILSDAGKTLMASIPAANLAAQTAAMKEAFTSDRQDTINDTLLKVEDLRNERAKKEAILSQLKGGGMAGQALQSFFSTGASDPYSLMAETAASQMAYQTPPSLTDGMKQTDLGAIQEQLIQEMKLDPTLHKKAYTIYNKGKAF